MPGRQRHGRTQAATVHRNRPRHIDVRRDRKLQPRHIAVGYHDLRVAKEGADTGQIAAVFD